MGSYQARNLKNEADETTWEDEDFILHRRPGIIRKIFKYLDLRDLKSKPPPRANAPPDNIEPHLDYPDRGVGPYGLEADSQLPPPARNAAQREAGGSASPPRPVPARDGQVDAGQALATRAGPTITSMYMSPDEIGKGPSA